jgi:membrane fusion protein (multidrug efflux system)
MDIGKENLQAKGEEAAPAKPRFKRRWVLLVLLLAALVFAAPHAWRWYIELRTTETTDNATLQGDVIAISSKIAGTVSSLEVSDNQRVQKDQVLLRLDPADYQIALAQAQATLELARRQTGAAQAGIGLSAAQSGGALTQAAGGLSLASTAISSAQAGVDTAKSNLDAAQAKLAQAQAQYELAQSDLRRARELTDAGVTPKQRLDQAESAYKVAQAAVQAAHNDIAVQQAKLEQAQLAVHSAQAQQTQSQGIAQSAKATKQQIAVQTKQYEATQAQVDVAEAALRVAQQQLSYTTLYAPAPGRIGRRSVEVGQRVAPAQPLLALVQDGLWIVANFKETQVDRIKPGQAVEVRVDTYRGKVFSARVDSISPASGAMFALLPPENASGNFTKVVQRIPVKIVFDPDALAGYEDLLVPGMSVIVKVKVQ